MKTLAKLQSFASELNLPGSLVASNRSGKKNYYYQPDPKRLGAGRQILLGVNYKMGKQALRRIAKSFVQPVCRICRQPIEKGENYCPVHFAQMTGNSATLRR